MDKKRFFDRMALVADLDNEPIPGKTLIEIVSDSSVLIENHCGVISYSSECVSVKTKQGCIIVSGSQLVLRKMSSEQIRICGTVFKVELRRKQ